LMTSVTEQLRLLTATRMHEAGAVSVTASANDCAAPTESADDRREQ
jgi:hypothetical protein